MRAKWFVIAAIVLTPLLFPLTGRGAPSTWDGEDHLIRMGAFHRALTDGQIPPRWAGNLAYGFGTPVLLFNWSLPYYVAEPFIIGGVTLEDAFKAVIALSIVGSFVTMYVFLKRLTNQWNGAIVGATLYALSPYHITTLYTRGALGEAVAFVFWPILFLIPVAVNGNNARKALVWGSLSFGLLMLSHQVMFLMIFPVWLAFTVWWAFVHRNIRVLVDSVSSLLLGLSISAFFWLPAFTESKFLALSSLTRLYEANFTTIQGLLWQRFLYEPPVGQLKIYATGWGELITVLLGTAALLFLLTHAGKKTLPRNLSVLGGTLGVALVTSLFSLFLTLPSSSFVWKHVPILPFVLYPPRFVALVSFVVPIASAAVLGIFSRFRRFLFPFLIGTTILFSLPLVPFFPDRSSKGDAYYYESQHSSDMSGEFLPIWVNKRFYFFPQEFRLQANAVITRGDGEVAAVTKHTSSMDLNVTARTPIVVTFRQFYFPGWYVETNRTRVPVEIGKNGEIVFSLPAGAHHVSARFGSTAVRTAGVVLSVAGMALLLLLWRWPFGKKARNTVQPDGKVTGRIR